MVFSSPFYSSPFGFSFALGLHARAKDNLNSFIDIRTFTTPKGITVWHVRIKPCPLYLFRFCSEMLVQRMTRMINRD